MAICRPPNEDCTIAIQRYEEENNYFLIKLNLNFIWYYSTETFARIIQHDVLFFVSKCLKFCNQNKENSPLKETNKKGT